MTTRPESHGAAGDCAQTVHPPRRTMLAAGLALAAGLTTDNARAQADPTRTRPQPGDRLVRASDSEPVPLTPDGVPLGLGQILAWPLDPADSVVRSGSRL